MLLLEICLKYENIYFCFRKIHNRNATIKCALSLGNLKIIIDYEPVVGPALVFTRWPKVFPRPMLADKFMTKTLGFLILNNGLK